jgi:hypothetical protein
MLSQPKDKFAHAREDVLDAVRQIRRNKLSNPHISEKRVSYMEIRAYIKIRFGYEMENVGARCRELARDLNPPAIRIEYDEFNWAWVTPIIVGMEMAK